MNTYPAIYECVDGLKYLYLDKQNYYSFERKIWDKSRAYDNHFNDGNITREYLANTYGKVESRDHAEFIIKLARSNGFNFGWLTSNSIVGTEEASSFAFYDNGNFYFYGIKCCMLSQNQSQEHREITIPLPPKEEDMKSENVKIDEWPKVGDKVSWGEFANICTVISLFDGFAWIQGEDGGFFTVKVSNLVERKKKDNELAKILIKLIDENLDGYLKFKDKNHKPK